MLENVLAVESQPGLPLTREDREYGSIEFTRHTEQERGHAQSGAVDGGTGRDRLAEIEIPPGAGIHGKKIETIPTDVCSPPDLVVSADLRPVVDELKPRGTVQARNADAALDAHEPSANRSANAYAGKTPGKPVTEVDTRYSHFVIRLQVCVRLVAVQTETNYAKTELGQQARAECARVI